MTFKMALIQLIVVDDKETNLKSTEIKIRETASKGAKVIVLPEMFNCPYHNDNFPKYAEEYPGITTNMLSNLSKELGIYIFGGSIPEKEKGNIYNTCYCFGPKGDLLGKHRKVHLFDVDIKGGISFKESDVLFRGNSATVFDTEFGRVGVAICYDMRFPEIIRKMTLEGAEMIVVPAAFNMTTGPAHWHILARTRALDNQVYMVLSSQARNTKGVYTAYGHSLVASPWGDIIQELGEGEGILYVDIDLEYVQKVRAELPLLKHRRTEVY